MSDAAPAAKPQPTAEEQGMTKGVSPWEDAWRRLRKNKMAMIGLVIVIVMSLSAILAGVLSPFEATYGFTWIKAQPPGFSHPACQDTNILTVGESPDCGDIAFLRASTIAFDVQKTQFPELRIKLRRGKVKSIKEGAVSMKTLAVAGPDEILVDTTSGEDGAVYRDIEIKTRKKLPDAILANFPDEPPKVLMLERRPTSPPVVRYEATVARGKITGLTREGVAVETAEFRGIKVVASYLDGKPYDYVHPLGTDLSGRDLFSRILYGGKISLLVGLVATLVSLLIGVVYGAVSGYYGGKVDALLMAIVDILYGIPYMFLVILLLVNFGSNILILFAALGAVQWLTMARIVRGQVLSLKQKEFIEAARMSGTGHMGILFNHLIPNTLGVVAVYTTLTVPAVILQESFLAFIGLSVTWNGENLDSWGALVKLGSDALGQGGTNWWLLIYPSIAMAATLFSLNFLGDGLRDALDPQQRGRT